MATATKNAPVATKGSSKGKSGNGKGSSKDGPKGPASTKGKKAGAKEKGGWTRCAAAVLEVLTGTRAVLARKDICLKSGVCPRQTGIVLARLEEEGYITAKESEGVGKPAGYAATSAGRGLKLKEDQLSGPAPRADKSLTRLTEGSPKKETTGVAKKKGSNTPASAKGAGKNGAAKKGAAKKKAPKPVQAANDQDDEDGEDE